MAHMIQEKVVVSYKDRASGGEFREIKFLYFSPTTGRQWDIDLDREPPAFRKRLEALIAWQRNNEDQGPEHVISFPPAEFADIPIEFDRRLALVS